MTNFQLLVDSLEQHASPLNGGNPRTRLAPIDRPSDNEEQKKFYSGKKKQHTLKSQLVCLPNGKDIIDVVVGFPGPTSDINLFREQQKKFDSEQKFVRVASRREGDKGYQGGKNILACKF
ncbi:hypothetical protein NIES2107_27970 [Nostoc carneum NIES-2107]|nr:hypothetical protein NIES2107_27970 [Nostoc carneum NIES-2107]